MPNFRRNYLPGGTFFFTLVTHYRTPFLCDPDAISILRRVFRECRYRWPLRIDALVILPDHLHMIWTLPYDDHAYSKRIGWSKKEFTKAWLATDHAEIPQSEGRSRDNRRGVWQSKFWEHTIRDEDDYAQHIQYIHFNPVKHGYVRRPYDWRFSSFRAYVRMGMYDRAWGVQGALIRDLDGMDATVGE